MLLTGKYGWIVGGMNSWFAYGQKGRYELEHQDRQSDASFPIPLCTIHLFKVTHDSGLCEAFFDAEIVQKIESKAELIFRTLLNYRLIRDWLRCSPLCSSTA